MTADAEAKIQAAKIKNEAVVIVGGGDEAFVMKQVLEHLGFTNVKIFQLGYEAWAAKKPAENAEKKDDAAKKDEAAPAEKKDEAAPADAEKKDEAAPADAEKKDEAAPADAEKKDEE